jgi:hypothetical protein
MAVRNDFSARSKIFCGEDKQLVFAIHASDGVTPQDVSGWAMEWVLRSVHPTPLQADRRWWSSWPVVSPPVLPTVHLTKSTSDGSITVTGTYNADPDVNTQRVAVAIADTDTEGLAGGTYKHALKRTDDGLETILSFGEFVLRSAAAV